MTAESRFRCSACGSEIDEERQLPFRCPAAVPGEDVDHVLVRELGDGAIRSGFGEDSQNPFLRYRELLHAYHFGRAHGLTDAHVEGILRELDATVAHVDGHGFTVTPFARCAELSEALGFTESGGVWVKDEAGNVAGSHKARHLFGILVYLRVRERLGLGPGRERLLAIASCGNAALAAAVLARGIGRALYVFVPPAADAEMVERLRALEARVTVCPREGASGDPSVAAFREVVADGAVPFTCQGTESGLAIEGGQTVGWEMATELGRQGWNLDRLFVQVGGGALGSACVAAFREARRAGLVERLPRLHAVQTAGGHPLARAWDRLTKRIVVRLGTGEHPDARGGEETLPAIPQREVLSRLLEDRYATTAVAEELCYAATHRSEFMWPWEHPPRSIAEGILDDEVYDWRAVVEGMIESGGYPVVVDDDAIRAANELANAPTRSHRRPASFTGTAGLAGLRSLVEAGAVAPTETVAVLFTGVRRTGGG